MNITPPVDFVTLLLWFFLAANPNLAHGNHWQYTSVQMPIWDTRRVIDVKVLSTKTGRYEVKGGVYGGRYERESDFTNQYRITLTARDMEVVAVATRQLDGYQVHFERPTQPDIFVPFYPTYIGREWKDGWKAISIMDDDPVALEESLESYTLYGKIKALTLSGKDPKQGNIQVYWGHQVGLRRLKWGQWDYQLADVHYQENPFELVKRADRTSPLLRKDYEERHWR